MNKVKINQFFASRVVSSIVAIALILSHGGCMSPDSSGFSIEKGVIKFENAEFSSCIDAIGDKTIMLEGDFLKVQVTVQNTGKRDLDFLYSFTWKDKYGMELTSVKELWVPITLHGRQEKVLEAVCPVPGAADFRLVIRPPK